MIDDLTGKKFDRLTVLRRGPDKKTKNGSKIHYWECVCDCGEVVYVQHYNLTEGSVRSCGCLSRDVHSRQNGLSTSRLYNVWAGIKKRCFSETYYAYKNYGGRGITMCDEWKNSFLSFYEWAVSNGYEYGLSIDRIDNDGNYEPSNCRWATRKTQDNNKRQNHFVEHNGESLSLAMWQERTGIRQETIRRRLKMGWSAEKALTTKTGERHNNRLEKECTKE